MTELIVLIVLAASTLVTVRFLQERRRQAILSAPPERAFYEVTLPYGIDDASVRMAALFRKVAPLVTATAQQRREGAGGLDFIVRADRHPGDQRPTLSAYIAIDPTNAPQLKRMVRTAFDQLASLRRLDEDPFRDVAEALRSEAGPEEPRADS